MNPCQYTPPLGGLDLQQVVRQYGERYIVG